MKKSKCDTKIREKQMTVVENYNDLASYRAMLGA